MPLALRGDEILVVSRKVDCEGFFRAEDGWKILGMEPFWEGVELLVFDDGGSSAMKPWQPVSMWSFIFRDGTGFSQIGQDTIVSVIGPAGLPTEHCTSREY